MGIIRDIYLSSRAYHPCDKHVLVVFCHRDTRRLVLNACFAVGDNWEGQLHSFHSQYLDELKEVMRTIEVI